MKKKSKTPLLIKRPNLQKKLCELISVGQPFNRACDYVGISTSAFYKWLSDGKEQESGIYYEFRNAILKAEASCMLKNFLVIQKAATEGKYPAAIWILENRFRLKNYEPDIQLTVNFDNIDVESLFVELKKSDDLVLLKGPIIDINEGEK